jgi:multidrug efflux system outer membrane protein
VLGPNYVRPVVDVPDAYRQAGDTGAVASVLPTLPAWWQGFGDPDLDSLVAEALGANHDLAIASARVEEFAARVTSTRAQALPQVGYGSGGGRQRSATGVVSGTYSAVLSASWEIDLWGRLRREDEAARANLLSTEQARLGVALSLVSAVITGYLNLLDLDRRLAIAEATVEGRRRNVELFQLRKDSGAVSEFEILQVTAEYETAQATVPDLQQAIARQEHALSTLVGRNPGPVKRDLVLEQLRAPPVPAGLPSTLIERRPDILQSEQQLVAANALVGAARTLYFPRLSLTGTGGGVSTELDELFSGPTRTWSYLGQLAGPIFAGGAIDSANLQAEARREQALSAYQRTIQSAFREVEDALVTTSTTAALVASLERRVDALRRAVELANLRYDNGYTGYLEVLDTERGLFSAELALSAARGDGYRSLVDLYRALGGDWIGEVAAPSPAPALPQAQADAGSDSPAAAEYADVQ